MLSCGGEAWTSQVIALQRSASNAIRTMGVVIGTTGSIKRLFAVVGEPAGTAIVQVGDYNAGLGDDGSLSLRQWRVYRWTGTGFTQTDGPTSFPVNPHVTDLAISTTQVSTTTTRRSRSRSPSRRLTSGNPWCRFRVPFVMKKLRATLLVGLVMATGACATRAPGGVDASSGAPLAATTDDPWPGRYRYLSTRVTQGGRDRPLVGAAAIEVSLVEVSKISVYAGCNILSMPVRLTGGRMLVGPVSSTKKGCSQDLHTQDTWLREFFEADPSMPRTGVEMVLASGDVEITLHADLSPS